MPMSFRFTVRDEKILRMLSLYSRVVGQRQASQHWYNGDDANCRRRMKQLVLQGLLLSANVRARPVPVLNAPLIRWQPGDANPSFAKVAYQCQKRWRMRHLQNCIVYSATTRTSQLFGGRARGEVRKEMQVTHDLGVTQIWLYLDTHEPDWADAWKGEDVMAHTRRGEKLPDGFIVDGNQSVLCVMEFGGSYDEQRIREFHDDCFERSLPYQLW